MHFKNSDAYFFTNSLSLGDSSVFEMIFSENRVLTILYPSP